MVFKTVDRQGKQVIGPVTPFRPEIEQQLLLIKRNSRSTWDFNIFFNKGREILIEEQHVEC